jgi:hypothetical protein
MREASLLGQLLVRKHLLALLWLTLNFDRTSDVRPCSIAAKRRPECTEGSKGQFRLNANFL